MKKLLTVTSLIVVSTFAVSGFSGPVRAAAKASSRKTCGSASGHSHMSASASQLYHEAWTNVGGTCDAEVEAWIDGGSGPTSKQDPNYAWTDVTQNRANQAPPFCGLYTGYSNHWAIEGSTWWEGPQWLQDQDYTSEGCGV